VNPATYSPPGPPPHAGAGRARSTRWRATCPPSYLSDTITHAGGYADNVEAYLLTRYAKQLFEVTHLGLPACRGLGHSAPLGSSPG
jgi:hypothetical protein